mmetsp:Transcript_6538/g.18845  ORF Transcript_6538/g.18845 Transcript_6538/m.18845 type:complete len:205 (-) Transcript_6538:1217-1831(-)
MPMTLASSMGSRTSTGALADDLCGDAGGWEPRICCIGCCTCMCCSRCCGDAPPACAACWLLCCTCWSCRRAAAAATAPGLCPSAPWWWWWEVWACGCGCCWRAADSKLPSPAKLPLLPAEGGRLSLRGASSAASAASALSVARLLVADREPGASLGLSSVADQYASQSTGLPAELLPIAACGFEGAGLGAPGAEGTGRGSAALL